jgi:ribosome maturation protein Sdo1
MECPICGAIAERIAKIVEGMTIACPTCGEFEIASSVIASGQLQSLTLEERAEVLDRAQRSAQTGARPAITPYSLA